MVAGTDDPEFEKSHSLEGVFGWFRDCPQQIKRTVVVSIKRASYFIAWGVVPATLTSAGAHESCKLSG
jgi:hypothetical protein